jgi:hypothetical protein
MIRAMHHQLPVLQRIGDVIAGCRAGTRDRPCRCETEITELLAGFVCVFHKPQLPMHARVFKSRPVCQAGCWCCLFPVSRRTACVLAVIASAYAPVSYAILVPNIAGRAGPVVSRAYASVGMPVVSAEIAGRWTVGSGSRLLPDKLQRQQCGLLSSHPALPRC